MVVSEPKYKKGVSKNLLDLCVGNDLEKGRLAALDNKSVLEVMRDKNGMEMGVAEWNKIRKQ